MTDETKSSYRPILGLDGWAAFVFSGLERTLIVGALIYAITEAVEIKQSGWDAALRILSLLSIGTAGGLIHGSWVIACSPPPSIV